MSLTRLSRDSLTRWEARSEEILTATGGSVLTEACVLRAFDRRRRELARLVTGRDASLFVGYDALELSTVLSAARELRVCAVLVNDLGSRHAVEYRALETDPTAGPSAGAATRVLARATGWTLATGVGTNQHNPVVVPPVTYTRSVW